MWHCLNSVSIFKRLSSLLFLTAVTVLFCLFSSAAGADTVRVGLCYGNNAIPTASLENEVGKGYRFGFFDSTGNFIALGSTGIEKITVCKDKNLFLSGGVFYESKPAKTDRLVGAYHLQTAASYDSFASALEASRKYPYGFPAFVAGSYAVRFEFYSTLENANADIEKYGDVKVVGGSTTCYTVVNTATGDILFEFDSASSPFAVSPGTDGTTAQTWFKGKHYYGDFRYDRRNGNDMTVVNILPTDLYVGCVLPCEFITSGGAESLKAGAVAIRTFAKATTKHKANGFDVCTSTDCQVYRGIYTGSTATASMNAAKETSGQCIYYDGKLIQALFYAANGGATESAANTWGSPYPYLIAQKDSYENSIQFPSQSWQYTVTPAQLRTFLQNRGYSCADIVSMEVTQRTEIGNVNRVVVTDANGKEITFTQDNVRLLQNLPGITYFSRMFTITPKYASEPSASPDVPAALPVSDGTNTETVRELYAVTASGTKKISAPVTVRTANGLISYGAPAGQQPSEQTPVGWTIAGRGYGHNVGLSQWGAYAMAAQGFRYDQILQFYYPGTKLG